jgi:hypothetical protein
MTKRQLSSIREQLNKLLRDRAACEQIAMEPGPMVAASFLERTVRPNQPQPYCYLSASIEGVSRHRYVPLKQAATWRRRAQRWRQFSQAMAQWVKLNGQIETLLRTLGQERCVPLPQASCASERRRGKP